MNIKFFILWTQDFHGRWHPLVEWGSFLKKNFIPLNHIDKVTEGTQQMSLFTEFKKSGERCGT